MLLIVTLITTILLQASVYCNEPYTIPGVELLESEKFILRGDYKSAERYLDDFIAENSEEPAGYLMKAALIKYRSFDYEDYSLEKEFRHMLERTTLTAGARIKRNPDDIWAQYYLNAAKSFSGAWNPGFMGLMRSVTESYEGARGMESILKKDAGFYDAQFILGSYRFWLNHNLNRIPLVSRDTAVHATSVLESIEKGKLTGILSYSVLMEMYLQTDMPEAVKLGKILAEQYPSCRIFLWQAGEAYKKAEMYEEAKKIFTVIADSFENDEYDDGSGMIRSWWKMATLAESTGRKSDCIYYSEKIIDLAEANNLTEQHKSRVEGARGFLKKMGTKR